jgi:hypothetical protein
MKLAKIKKWLRDKKGLELEELGKAIIAIAILVLLVVLFVILSQHGQAAIEYVKRLFRL